MAQALSKDSAVAAFATVGIQPRRKGQRYDKSLFGWQLDPNLNTRGGCIRGTPAGSKITQVGEGLGFQGYSIIPEPVYYFAVELPNGMLVPAYSFTPGSGQNGYMICQDYTFKAKKVK